MLIYDCLEATAPINAHAKSTVLPNRRNDCAIAAANRIVACIGSSGDWSLFAATVGAAVEVGGEPAEMPINHP